MKFSLPTMQALFGLNIFDKPDNTPQKGEFLRNLLQLVIDRAKPKGLKTNIGPTHPLRGEIAYKNAQKHTKISKQKQFPLSEILPDGRHRYFLKNGELIDRTN